MHVLDEFRPIGLLIIGLSCGLGCSSNPDSESEQASSSSALAPTAKAQAQRGAPATCQPSISPEVAEHVRAMAQRGWAAVNKENGLRMHGCRGAASPRECLASYPRVTEKAYARGWEYLAGATLRVLGENAYPSSFWTRTSPDGRFVAHGRWYPDADSGLSATIIDLQENRAIPVRANYDSGFMPDNSGFTFIGSGVKFCNQSLLTSSPRSITFREPECISNDDIGLYQSVGAALGGGDYWVASGQFQNDQGAYQIRHDPDATSGANSTIKFTPMIHDGRVFSTGDTIDQKIPYTGDPILSPSTRLLMTRLDGPQGQSIGYSLRKLVPTRAGDKYTLETPEIARYCVHGAKASISYDERWALIHHYVTDKDAQDLGFTGPDDPAFADYRQKGASNVYLLDLLSGKVRRVTTMQPGQYALYPHFRSDGWIYFMVRNAPKQGAPAKTAVEYLVASDAALVTP